MDAVSVRSHSAPPEGTTGHVPASVLGITRVHASAVASAAFVCVVVESFRHAASPTTAKTTTRIAKKVSETMLH